MSFFPTFRTRNPSRDSDADRARAARLRQSVEQIIEEIRAERTGLKRRLASASTDAGFAAEALENGADATQLDQRIGELTSTMQACEQRLEALSKQIEALDGILKQVDDYAAVYSGAARTTL